MEWFRNKSHLMWLVVAVVAVMVIYWGTTLIGSLIAHIIAFTIVGGLVYGLDWNYTKILGTQSMQFAAAVALAILWGFLSSASLWMIAILAVCDVIILMCVFTASAVYWPNKDAVAERLQNDPLGAARDGLHAGTDALRRGVGAAGEEASRLKGHFSANPSA